MLCFHVNDVCYFEVIMGFILVNNNVKEEIIFLFPPVLL